MTDEPCAIGTIDDGPRVTGPSGAEAIVIVVELEEDTGVTFRSVGRVTRGDLLRVTLDDGRRVSVRVDDCDLALTASADRRPLTEGDGALLGALRGAGAGPLSAREAHLRAGDRVALRGELAASGALWIARGRVGVTRAP